MLPQGAHVNKTLTRAHALLLHQHLVGQVKSPTSTPLPVTPSLAAS